MSQNITVEMTPQQYKEYQNILKWKHWEHIVKLFLRSHNLIDIKQTDWSVVDKSWSIPVIYDIECKYKDSLMSNRYAGYNVSQIKRQLRFLQYERESTGIIRNELYFIYVENTKTLYYDNLFNMVDNNVFVQYKWYDVIDTRILKKVKLWS